MAPKSQFILDRLGDFWRRFKEQTALTSYWDGLIELTSNIRLNLEEINQGKGLFTVPVKTRSSPVLFVLDSTTRLTPPSGYAASFKIDAEIESIPQLSGDSDSGGMILVESVAYDITSPGVLSFRSAPPRLLFGENVYSNRETIYKNFGFPIGFKKSNSEAYRRQVQGLWFALWNGGSVGNIRLGTHILFGLPFVQKGTVRSVTANLDGTTTVVIDDETFILPPYLQPTVLAGDVITNFKAISTGAELFDVINSPSFFLAWDIPEAKKFFTFVPTILDEVLVNFELETGEPFDLDVIKNFIDKIRPAYTNYVLGVKSELKDTLRVFLDSALLEERIELSSTVDLNYRNHFEIPAFETLNGLTAETYDDDLAPYPEYDLDPETIAFRESLTIKDLDTDTVLVQV